MILALETSTRCASLAVLDERGDSLLWESRFETDRSHNSIIFGPVEEALGRFGREITMVAVGLGPGSYGGIRVGIAVANGLALARGWRTQGVSSLEAFGAGEDCFIVGDARRKTFFLAEVSEGALRDEPLLLPAEELEQRLEGIQGQIYSAEETVVERFRPVELAFPRAQMIGKRASQRVISDESEPPLEPHYLRAPYITTPKSR